MQTRLTFIAAIALLVAGMPATVQAEQPKRIPQIGFLALVARADYDPAGKDPIKDGLLEGLNALGYVEGKNIHVDYRVPRKPEEIAEIARDLVQHKVDIIVTGGPQYIEAAKRATDSIPIVTPACADRADRAGRQYRPAGGQHNGNGLHLVRPHAQATATLYNRSYRGCRAWPCSSTEECPLRWRNWRMSGKAAAKILEIDIQPADVRDASGFAAAFAAIKVGNPEGLHYFSRPSNRFTYVKELAGFAAEQRLPSMFGFREFCDAGGLLCYGASLKSRMAPLCLFYRQDTERH